MVRFSTIIERVYQRSNPSQLLDPENWNAIFIEIWMEMQRYKLKWEPYLQIKIYREEESSSESQFIRIQLSWMEFKNMTRLPLTHSFSLSFCLFNFRFRSSVKARDYKHQRAVAPIIDREKKVWSTWPTRRLSFRNHEKDPSRSWKWKTDTLCERFYIL